MKKLNKSYIFILSLFILCGAVSWSLYLKVFSQKDTVDAHIFPKTIGEWGSKDLKISEDEYAILETRNAFARRYTHTDGRTIVLLVVYSQNNRKVSHPPEICYSGSGITIVKNTPKSISYGENSLEANSLLLEQGNVQEVSYYWFKVGKVFTPNYWKQQFLIAFKTITGKPASSALVRISSSVKEQGIEGAEETIEDFAELMTPLLFEYLP